jgi:hypothetical protein
MAKSLSCIRITIDVVTNNTAVFPLDIPWKKCISTLMTVKSNFLLVSQNRIELRKVWDTLPGVWVLVVLGLVFFVVSKVAVAPNDFWWHLRAGQVIFQQRTIPTTDLFSFTQYGQSWIYQSWITEVFFYLLNQVGGIPLLLFLKAIIITAAYTLLLYTAIVPANGNLRFAAYVTLLAAVLGHTNTDLRPQVISYPLFAWTLWCVTREERSANHKGAIWSLPPLFVLWANSHGAFIFGLALLVSSTAGELLDWLRKRSPFPKRMLIVSLLCAIAVFITPTGLGIVNYVLEFVRNPITSQLNEEFMPPTIRSLTGQLFFGSLGLIVALLVITRYIPRAAEALRLLVFTGLALSAVRCVIWSGFIAAPILAAALAYWARDNDKVKASKSGSRLVNRLLVTVMLLLCAASLPWFRPYIHMPGTSPGFLTPETPEKAVDYLCALSQQRPLKVFHTEAVGSYLIWACPAIPVFIDTRIELYPADQWQDYISIREARYNWEELLAKYGMNVLLLQTDRHKELVAAAAASPNWQRTYEDKLFVVFQKRDGK